MNVTTNDKNAKLTRPVAIWKRFLGGVVGILALLVAVHGIADGAGWIVLLPIVFGIGGLSFAAQKYETIG